MEIELDKVNEWYAKKIGKQVVEFDEMDSFCAKVAYDYAVEIFKSDSLYRVSDVAKLFRQLTSYERDEIINDDYCDTCFMDERKHGKCYCSPKYDI